MEERQMRESGVIFQGQGPFLLPNAQYTKAIGHTDNTVTVVLYCILDEVDSGSVPINVPMTSATARQLAINLLMAAENSKKQD